MTLSNAIANAAENAILLLVFNGQAWAGYADNAASSPQINIAVSLNTADPGEAGTASTSEAAYTGYTRKNVLRDGTGWTVTANSVSPAADISFPPGTGGSGIATHFASSKSNATPPTGAQALLWRGEVQPPITLGNGVTPILDPATTFTLD